MSPAAERDLSNRPAVAAPLLLRPPLLALSHDHALARSQDVKIAARQGVAGRDETEKKGRWLLLLCCWSAWSWCCLAAQTPKHGTHHIVACVWVDVGVRVYGCAHAALMCRVTDRIVASGDERHRVRARWGHGYGPQAVAMRGSRGAGSGSIRLRGLLSTSRLGMMPCLPR